MRIGSLKRGAPRMATGVATGVVALLAFATPAFATNHNTGSGTITGFVNLNSPGVPPLLSTSTIPPTVNDRCYSSNWSYQDATPAPAGDVAVMVNQAIVWYDGTMSISATGGSSCESVANFTNGTVSGWSANGYNPATTGSISCTGDGSSANTYLRIGPIVEMGAAGTCTTNGYSNGNMNMEIVGAFTPTGGNGITSPVTQAAFTAVWGAAT
jgi:hypothetical protein